MVDGRVTGMGLSYDARYLVSSASDGTMYISEARGFEGLESAASAPAAEGAFPEALPGPPPVDITNAREYTIEEAKQKAERDGLMAAAEAKKLGIKEYLAQIRAEFEALLAENISRPEAERLPRSELEIDPGEQATPCPAVPPAIHSHIHSSDAIQFWRDGAETAPQGRPP
jgi:hypothetical protein